MDGIAEHVIVVAHDDAIPGVDHFALIAFDVEEDARAVELLGGRIGRRRVAVLELVVCDGEEGASERVGVGNRRRRGVDSCFAGSLLFLWAERAVLTPEVPGGQIVRVWQAAEEIAY